MSSSDEYGPPPTVVMAATQNSHEALRLLLAQRRLYSGAKLYVGLRWFGLTIIGLGAPVVVRIWPELDVAAAAVAGLWLFIGRTTLRAMQTRLSTQAASVQEQFDFMVFGMSEEAQRSTMPLLEDIIELTGGEEAVSRYSEEERLRDWYPFEGSNLGEVSVALCQRANVTYSDRLLRTTARVWTGAVVAWSAVLLIWCMIDGLSLTAFVLGIFLPLLPALLDVVQYVAGVRRASIERRNLADAIGTHLDEGAVDPQALLVWQERMFELRRAAPQIPDFIYKLRRTKNEQVMHAATQQLSTRPAQEDE
ncbi:S-4TM family putative pore-forming effector [Nocardioides sp. NPDC004968]|uniref:S-4TM family putative pore-forming effector n=1 Tax=Nocardioides sp. NPDC004968 TaxID=3155894 RepID=UPI0033ADA29B